MDAEGNQRSLTSQTSISAIVALSFLVTQVGLVWFARAIKNLGDVALIEIETRRVFSLDPPLLGAYSRYGWRHPGAALFWVWAPVYELLGKSDKALSTAAALLAALALWAIVATSPRQRGFWIAVAGGALLLIATLGEDSAAYAWNITATMVPVMVVLVGCAISITTPAPMVPLLATVSWWLMVFEAHAGTGVVIAPAVAASVAVVVYRRVRGPWVATDRRLVGLWVGIAAALSSPVLIDAALHRGGNLRTLIAWSLSNDEPTTGIGDAVTLVARASSLSFLSSPPQPHFFFAATVQSGLVPGVMFLTAAIGFALAVRRRNPLAIAALAILALTWVSGLVAIARIPSPVYFWLVAWMQPLAWLTWAVSVWAILVAVDIPERVTSRVRIVVPRLVIPGLAIVALAAGCGVAAAWGSGAPVNPDSYSDSQITTLADGIEADLGDDDVVELTVSGESLVDEVFAAGLLNELDRRDVAACAGPLWEFKVSAPWRCQQPTATVVLRVEDEQRDPPPGTELVVVWDFLNPADRARVDLARVTVRDYLDAQGRTDLEDLIGTEFGHLIAEDPDLEITNPTVLDALEELDWAASFRARRIAVYG